MNYLKNLFNIVIAIVLSAIIVGCTGTPTPVNLAVKVTGKGSIVSASNTINCKSNSGDCNENYTAITDETLTATADPGYYFSGWTPYPCAGVDTQCKLTVSSALSGAANGLYTLQAEFKPNDSGLKNVSYTHNAMGQRNSKTVGGVTTYFIYDLQGRVLAELDSQGQTVRDNVYLGSEQIASFSGGQTTYIFNDHLATPVLAVDGAGHPVWSIETDPFGTTKKIYRATDISARFPGQYADEETGFNYNYHRTYDPYTGRYIESDPIGLRGGINPYLYAWASPTNAVDPLGLDGYWASLNALAKVTAKDYSRFSPHPDARGRLAGILGGRTALKCNLFLNDMLTAGGHPPGRMQDGRVPSASEWENPAVKIDGYIVLPSFAPPKQGDVVAYHGHVGLYFPSPTGESQTISASAINNEVVWNSWAFRDGDSPTIRRCTCDIPSSNGPIITPLIPEK